MNSNGRNYYHFKSIAGFAYINFQNIQTPPTLQTMKEALSSWCSTKNNKANIQYLAFGKTIEGTNKHGHVFFILEKQADVMRKPLVNINGKEMKINFSPFTKMDAFDGSYLSIIEYIKNQGKKHNTRATFEEYGNLKTTKGHKVGDTMIEESLRMNSKAEAIAYLRNISPAWVMNNEKKFGEMYDKQHSRDRKHRINIKLNPWKETNPVVQGARAWIHTLETIDIKRPPALVIVSETKLGKTEFINDLLKEKQVDEFRGRIMIDGHDENREYDFRLFDDANLTSIDWEDFKAMISTRGEKVRVNVKYGHLDVITVPTIIVLNPGSFKELQTMAGNKGDRDWLDKNTVVLSTKEKLYIENNNNNDDRIAMLQELYGELPPNLINAIAANDRLQEELPPIDNIDDVDDNYLDEILNDMEMTDVPEDVVRRDVFDLPLKRKEPILTTEESNLGNTLPEDEIQK
ncbi:hypothetical protein ENU1_177790 [Entamoeba nuttalli P19]|uniref:Replication protein n=2 Tax=Entamoeba nuttalli TaxID=412467 RepID=K2H6D6_ENTNP|nr:hypothetical protein ENU1_177790 [Entamoeba nuttalli P19]EKE38059.1 hypothetical protein ENU1_177790 [Entamoeba nuttalli P19]|eukprot:XP_008859606.1 hypothetical protein ENU1_177790 [Entamoeba nuttalli P19]